MENYKKIIADSKFKVTDYDDAKKMKAIDLVTGEEMKKEIYPLEVRFESSNGRRIIYRAREIEIDYNENTHVKYSWTKIDNTYIVSSKNSPAFVETVITKPNGSIDLDIVGTTKTNILSKEGIEKKMVVYQLPTKSIIGINNHNMEVPLSKWHRNSATLFAYNIINQTGMYKDEAISKGMSIVGPTIAKDNTAIYEFLENNKDKYIEKMENEKLLLDLTCKFKIQDLEENIEILNNAFGTQKQKVKTSKK